VPKTTEATVAMEGKYPSRSDAPREIVEEEG
jgi:hypothetical protein